MIKTLSAVVISISLSMTSYANQDDGSSYFSLGLSSYQKHDYVKAAIS
jgi:hypothetical protein